MTILSFLCPLLFSFEAQDLEERHRRLEQRVDEEVSALERENQQLRARVEQLESDFTDFDGADTLVLFLIGIFCGVWAQNTGRSPWLWFFFGFALNFIALIVLCVKNSGDVVARRTREDLGRE